MAAGELGWSVSGFHRGVYEVAKHRAKLYILPVSDFYRHFFVSAHSCVGSWAHKSLLLLRRLGIDDWSDWSSTHETFSEYCSYVWDALEHIHLSTWRACVQKHRIPVPVERVMPGISVSLQTALALELPWHVLLQQLSHARLKCGLIALGHLAGRRTVARSQQCIFCNQLVSCTWMHTFGNCIHWTAHRTASEASLGLDMVTMRSWDFMYTILTVDPRSPSYCVCLGFIDAVAAEAGLFWKRAAGQVWE